jgi:L-rhamnose mutarotase
MNKHYLALDLKDDLIEEYDHWHQNVWPEIRSSIINSGILNMEIYRTGNRLVMIMETDGQFSFDKKNELDKNNAKVQEWETLMWKYQQPLPWAKDGEKWILMNKIFSLNP